MATSEGSCNRCKKILVFLKWREERVVIVVACSNCRAEVIFDLEEMYAQIVEEPTFEEILRDFNPRGKPS